MHELTINLHIHTVYSDGSGLHKDVARAALISGLDVVLISDHNVLVQNAEGYLKEGKKIVLVLVGEEIHDQDRDPQKNHMLVFGVDRELATLADDPQILINNVRKANGICFIAHPVDPELPVFHETDISWVDWHVTGYTGIELWNGFSELKTIVKGRLDGLRYAYMPKTIARGPLPETLKLWDRLMETGQRVVAVGGSDAHARKMTLGPLSRVVFPYTYHFSAINTHLIVPKPLTGDLKADKQMVLDALAAGHAFVGYDLAARTHGFRFSGQGRDRTAIMGDEIPAAGGVTLQMRVPQRAECRLIKNGTPIKIIESEVYSHITSEPGVYRVEVYRRYLGRQRSWIFSNPIYVR